ncbi:hypothetical protein D1007_41970 [Hordeum vulgare]|uniref:F-box domain-containing protein n=1 Tax=Hordeum vulgare subsp. vulgare TaxID=112509 RepID=A0A8I6YPJ6_HORVV|nr:hypothetical protein D1007_41970 [Hordeum vulgare]
MGLSLGKTATPGNGAAEEHGVVGSPWPDLPPELAAEILARLLSHTDRLSFGVVCRGWRLAAREQGLLLPPSMPWINIGRGAYMDLAGNGKACRFATPKGYRARATFGSWVLYEHDLSSRCFLGDPFSPSTPAIEVPCHYKFNAIICHNSVSMRFCQNGSFLTWPLKKMVVCSPHLIVATSAYNCPLKIACFRPSNGMAIKPATLLWSDGDYLHGHQHHACDFTYKDIAFQHGKIFALSLTENLFAYDFATEEMWLSQTWSRVEHAIKERPVAAAGAKLDYHNHHLLTSSDKQKLLMVRWRIPLQEDRTKFDHRPMDLQVFEADLQKGRWSQVKDLGGQALFIGQTGSRALAVGDFSDGMFQANRVFILGDDWALYHASRPWCKCFDCKKLGYKVPSYCVYDMISGEASLVSLGGRDHCLIKSPKMAWFFPAG